MTEVEVDQYYCGTAMCYKAHKDRRNAKNKPFIWACPSDFMVLPTLYSNLSQLRLPIQKRVRPVKTSKTARPDDGLKTPKGSEWQGESLDDELLILMGPNLSARDVIRSLEAVVASIRRRGLTVARIDQDGSYGPAFERIDSR